MVELVVSMACPPKRWRPSSSQEAGSDLIQGVQLLWLRLAAPQGTAAARSAGGEAARGEALATWNQSRSHPGVITVTGGMEAGHFGYRNSQT